MMAGYRKRVLALFERDPSVLMVAMRDGKGHVIGLALHPDFLLGVEEMPLRLAISTMPRHERKVWLAIEVGYREDANVIAGVPIKTERFGEPMTHEECAEYYGYTNDTVRVYLGRARRHLKDALGASLHSAMSRGSGEGHERLLRRVLQAH